MSSLYQVWSFVNVMQPGQTQDGYDRLYVPQLGNTTGDLDIHDMAVDGDGRLVFVNTLFGCLATLSDTPSFKPIWRTPFISRLASEDRKTKSTAEMLKVNPCCVMSGRLPGPRQAHERCAAV